MDLIDHWAQEIRRLEQEIVKARQAALSTRARTSYFVFFTSQKDAAIAAQTNLHPEDGHSFRVYEAPGPEEVLMASAPSVLRCSYQSTKSNPMRFFPPGRIWSFCPEEVLLASASSVLQYFADLPGAFPKEALLASALNVLQCLH